MNSPRAFRAERLSWRAVVQLNVVRSVRLVLDAIADAAEAQGLSLDVPEPELSSPVSQTTSTADGSSSPTPTETPQGQTSIPVQKNGNGSDIHAQMQTVNLITSAHVALRARLLPLLDAESVLLSRLMPVAAATGTSLREIENSHATTSSSSSSTASSLRNGKQSAEGKGASERKQGW